MNDSRDQATSPGGPETLKTQKAEGNREAIDKNRVPPWIRQVSIMSWGFLGAVGAVAVLVAAFGALRTLMIPLILAGFLAIVFAPSVAWLEKRRVPRPLGALIVLIMIFAIVAVSMYAVVKGVVDQSGTLETQFEDVAKEAEALLKRAGLGDQVNSIVASVKKAGSSVGTGMGSAVGSVVDETIGLITGLLLGSVLLYYLLKDGPAIVDGFATGGAGKPETTSRILNDAAGSVRSYMKGRTILALIQAVVIGALSAVLGVPLAFAIALVNFIGGFIPLVGGLMGGAFAVLMALSVGGGDLALLMLGVVLFVSVGLEHVLQPKLVGDKLEIHPIMVLFATVAGGVVMGMVGMLLGAPAVAIARMLWRELKESGFFTSPTVEPGAEST